MEKLFVVFGLLLSTGVGVTAPCSILVFRDLVNVLTVPPDSGQFRAADAYPIVIWFVVIGCILLLASFVQASLLGISSKRQLYTIRLLYFKAILRQDASWFDRQSAGELINKISQCTQQIEEGIGTKIGEFVKNISGFVAGIIIAFSGSWKLTLVACAMLPFVVIAFSLFGFIMKHYTVKELSAYSRAGSIANEVLSAIRTVFAFGGEQKELERYSKELKTAESVGIHKNMAVGGVTGSIDLTIFCSSALIFWYGIKLIIEENYDQGSVVLVFINVLLGSIYLGLALPNFQYFMNATASAREVYGTIEREPPIDKDGDGVRLPNFVGNIEFIGVSFSYPSRPDIPVLLDFNLKLESGKTVALVGPSGSGKSTIVHMLQRLYDPLEGQIRVEGVDIRSLALKDYRAQLGSVQQEPVLFEGSIADNIRMGKLDATQAEIEEAAKLANAHEFILQQPEAYDTIIGERGGGMSGGQKQRIAIARALIRQPKLLLLDEATSALDTKSERIVQEALEKASVGRTTVVVAHRLTTVRNADLIIVLERGVVRESGTHAQLVAKNGLYAAMLQNQQKCDLTAESDEAKEDEGDWTPTEMVFDKLTIPDGVWRRTSKDYTASVGSTVSIKQRFSVISQAFSEQLKKASPIKRLFALNRPELVQIILGCICCMIAGAVQPSFAILYSEIYDIFLLQAQPDLMNQRTSLICGLMALLGFISFFSMLGYGYLFGVSGERLTRRLRSQYFEAILRQEIGWFDRPENQAGALTAKLATEASKLKNISGSQLGTIMKAVVLVITTVIIAFVNSWQLSLLFLGFFPLLVIAEMFQVQNMSGSQVAEASNVMRVAQEAISNDRTVCALNLEAHFYEQFRQSMRNDYKATIRRCLLFALVYSLTQSIGTLSFGAVFALGVYLLEKQVLSVLNLFRCFSVMEIGAQSLGQSASFGPDAKEAMASAKGILATIDRPSQIPLDSGIVPSTPFKGRVSFKHLYFRYPTRTEAQILKNFSHTIDPGQTVALVGQSGCGKSTLLQLVQRFYDPSDHGPESGVFFDEWNLRQVAPRWIRQQIGIVSQEPNLFDLTLAENIAYGDNTREVPMEEIIDAARQANIHDFICTLPEGYQTMAGQHGTQLSGGQKQRIAIARALVRKPALLLLDEATSALDNESERIVQAALDSVIGSRTSLVVAHRLTTVQEADLIVVLEGGRKIETGPPAALMAAKGAFYALHNAEKTQ